MESLAPEDLVDGWSDLSTRSLGPGSRLGRYELLLPVAYGGMARVWLARLRGQRGFYKLVAIKTILPHLAHDAEFQQMFLDEARIAAAVHHPNVTEVYELGEEGRVLYLAMEWVNGESLVHVVRGLRGRDMRGVEPRVAARIVAEACAGLHSAHELTDDRGRLLDVVHRDVSPHNILVSLEGTVKVTDFGVARALGQSHQTTATGHVKGKVAYMAPEIVGADAFDRRSDIFAMGCVLYETVTGRLPFRGGNDPQVMQAILTGSYEPAQSVVRDVSPELSAIIDCALARDPRRRFATAEQMRIALEEWLVRSGPLVTPAHVGAVVRRRLGAHLDQRRDRVRAAMASRESAGDEGPSRAARRLRAPSEAPPLLPSPVDPSHSGIVATSPDARRVHAALAAMPLAPAPVALPAPPAGRLATEEHGDISGARYAVAAAAGIVFAVLVGAVAVVVWGAGSGHPSASRAGGAPSMELAVPVPAPSTRTPRPMPSE